MGKAAIRAWPLFSELGPFFLSYIGGKVMGWTLEKGWQALSGTAAEMAEAYLKKQGLMPAVVPEGPGTTYTDGLAYRSDLPGHLAGPDGFTKSGQLSGTHNLQEATAALDAQGATYNLVPTSTTGISELKRATPGSGLALKHRRGSDLLH